ncbi:MAG: hypothetical protein SFZ24_05020 [Planctomycetota bacterium]|nr:hypothetical protein [Planctomycetota bacterium]
MMTSAGFRALAGSAALLLLTASSLAQFENAEIRGEVAASSVTLGFGGTGEDNSELFPFSNVFDTGFNLILNTGASAGVSATATASASQFNSFTETLVSVSGSVNSDVDNPDDELTKGVASAYSSLDVVFTINESRYWSFPMFNLGGVHAASYVSLVSGEFPGGTVVFSFSSISPPNPEELSGQISPGTYTLAVSASAFTNAFDGYNGLFASASFELDFELTTAPPGCPGDANGDSAVNFSDIVEVLRFWGFLYAPDVGPGDANNDGRVDFLDVTEVLRWWNTTC